MKTYKDYHKYNRIALCCNCGYAVKLKNMFKKEYKSTAILLCKNCAKKLSDEIMEELK